MAIQCLLQWQRGTRSQNKESPAFINIIVGLEVEMIESRASQGKQDKRMQAGSRRNTLLPGKWGGRSLPSFQR